MKASGKPLLTTISSAFIDYNSSVVTSFINSYSNSTTTTYSSNNDGNSHSNSNRNKNSNSNNDNITSALTASIESTKVTTNPNSSKEEEKVIRTRTNLLYSITIELTNTFQLCNPNFQLSPTTTQKRILTIPSEGKYNNNLDNVDSNLICKVHDKLTNNLTNTNYVILDLLGTGTFGQVFRCQKEDTKEVVAIKIIKNKPAYYNQGMLEMKILRLLNKTYDPLNQKHIVRLLESFECNNHICLVFEQLSMSLLDVLTQNQYRGLPLSIVQRFTRQIITALVAMEDANVIHCDLKPENILLVPISKDKIERKTLKSTDKTVVSNSLGTTTDQSNVSNNNSSNNLNEMDDSNGNYSNSSNQTNDSTTQQTNTSSPNSINENKKTKKSGILSDIKVIDFGSACFEGRTIYSYIQSRFCKLLTFFCIVFHCSKLSVYWVAFVVVVERKILIP